MPSSEAIAGTAKCRRQCIASDPGRISFSESHSTCNAKPRHQAALRRPPRCTWPEQDKHSVMMLQSQQNALYWTQRAEPHNCEHGGLYRATLGKNDMRKLTDSWNHSARQLCIDPLSRQVFIYGELLPYDGAIWR